MRPHVRTLHKKAKKAYRYAKPSNVIAASAKRKVIEQFAKKYHLVYFGYIGRSGQEDHRLVRGLTQSTTHIDNHYCIGNIDGHDLILLERSDEIKVPGKTKEVPHTWLIVQIDLHESLDLPHIFLGTRDHSDAFYSRMFMSFAKLRKVPVGTFGKHADDFVNHYSIYSSPMDALKSEQLFSVDITKIIGVHFRPLAIEVVDSSLYIYADNKRPTLGLIETMIKNGLWLADQLNKRGSQI